MKYTVVGLWTQNAESQMHYHVDATDKGEAIRIAQDMCRDELTEDGSIELEDDPDDWIPEHQEPLDVAGVFLGHLSPE